MARLRQVFSPSLQVLAQHTFVDQRIALFHASSDPEERQLLAFDIGKRRPFLLELDLEEGHYGHVAHSDRDEIIRQRFRSTLALMSEWVERTEKRLERPHLALLVGEDMAFREEVNSRLGDYVELVPECGEEFEEYMERWRGLKERLGTVGEEEADFMGEEVDMVRHSLMSFSLADVAHGDLAAWTLEEMQREMGDSSMGDLWQIGTLRAEKIGELALQNMEETEAVDVEVSTEVVDSSVESEAVESEEDLLSEVECEESGVSVSEELSLWVRLEKEYGLESECEECGEESGVEMDVLGKWEEWLSQFVCCEVLTREEWEMYGKLLGSERMSDCVGDWVMEWNAGRLREKWSCTEEAVRKGVHGEAGGRRECEEMLEEDELRLRVEAVKDLGVGDLLEELREYAAGREDALFEKLGDAELLAKRRGNGDRLAERIAQLTWQREQRLAEDELDTVVQEAMTLRDKLRAKQGAPLFCGVNYEQELATLEERWTALGSIDATLIQEIRGYCALEEVTEVVEMELPEEGQMEMAYEMQMEMPDDVKIEMADEMHMEMADEVLMEMADEVQMELADEVQMEMADDMEMANEGQIELPDEVQIEMANEVHMEMGDEVQMETADVVEMEMPNVLQMEIANEVDMADEVQMGMGEKMSAMVMSERMVGADLLKDWVELQSVLLRPEESVEDKYVSDWLRELYERRGKVARDLLKGYEDVMGWLLEVLEKTGQHVVELEGRSSFHYKLGEYEHFVKEEGEVVRTAEVRGTQMGMDRQMRSFIGSYRDIRRNLEQFKEELGGDGDLCGFKDLVERMESSLEYLRARIDHIGFMEKCQLFLDCGGSDALLRDLEEDKRALNPMYCKEEKNYIDLLWAEVQGHVLGEAPTSLPQFLALHHRLSLWLEGVSDPAEMAAYRPLVDHYLKMARALMPHPCAPQVASAVLDLTTRLAAVCFTPDAPGNFCAEVCLCHHYYRQLAPRFREDVVGKYSALVDSVMGTTLTPPYPQYMVVDLLPPSEEPVPEEPVLEEPAPVAEPKDPQPESSEEFWGRLQRKTVWVSEKKSIRRNWVWVDVNLRGGVLFFHRNKKADKAPLELRECCCSMAEDYVKRPFVFRVFNPQECEYLFQADSQALADEWCLRIQQVCGLAPIARTLSKRSKKSN